MALSIYEKLKHAVRYWLLRRLPTCQSTVEKISLSMEQRLSFSDRVKVKIHLWICAWCQWYLEHLQTIRDAARTTADQAPEAVSATLSNEARERIRRTFTSQN